MKKLAIIIIIASLVIGGISYWVYRQVYLKTITPSVKGDTYEYKSAELKKMSEEAGINLEKGMVEQPEQKESMIYKEQKEEVFINKNNLQYAAKLIINEANHKEWLVRVRIPKEADKKYGIWKQEGKTDIVFMEELKSSGDEEWEYKSEGKQELKGTFYISAIGTNNKIIDPFYTIQK